jgi:hypothetical protein
MSSEDEDTRLEEMLRQAALLESQMRGRSSLEGSVYSRQSAQQEPVDDMLRQAELLSQKMRSSRQQAFAAQEVDDDEASVDDMLRKAELLSRQMRTPNSSPPRTRKMPTLESATTTPGLIRQSEDILSKMYQPDQRPTIDEMNTPELMRQTEHLLGKMRSASSLAGSSASSRDGSYYMDSGGYNSDASSKREVLTAKMKAAEAILLTSKKKKKKRHGSGQEPTRSEELRRLMEQALTSWSGSGEQKGRVKDALEQIVPNLSSTVDTPSTVSLRPPDGDDISSVGSLSPRSRKSTARATSLLNTSSRPPPSPSNNIDAAEEMVRKMAMALQEARSGDSQEIVDPASLLRRLEEEDTSEEYDQPTPKRDNKPTGPPTLPSLSNKSGSKQKQAGTPRSNKRNMPRPPPPNEPNESPPPRKERSSVSFTPNRAPMSSEEAQYNAIMAAIDSTGGRVMSWEKVESAGAEDDDYVPLADYSKQGGTRSLGVGSFEIPVMGRSPRVRRRRRKVGRILVMFLALIAAGYVGLRTWRSGDSFLDTEPTILTKESVYFEDPVPEYVVPEPIPVPPAPVPQYSNAIVIRAPSPWVKMRRSMAKVARRARRQFIRAIINLTPPWERFCVEGKTCRDTDYLLKSLDHP